MITTQKSFYCGEHDHMVKDCRWKNTPCFVEGCRYKMMLMVSKVERSYGCRFLRCKNQPLCGAFKWLDEPSRLNSSCSYENIASSSNSACAFENRASSSNSSNPTTSGSSSKVKVVKESHGTKLTFEGNVEDVVELLKKTHMY